MNFFKVESNQNYTVTYTQLLFAFGVSIVERTQWKNSIRRKQTIEIQKCY